ncbi:MAG TPA: phosphatidylglycerophosphatase A [Clostridia bacterium]|nr:phosphatidylglycerophosphatase A [Clostridia bacterium]
MDASPINDSIEVQPPVKAPMWAWATATFFGIGTLRPGPGTWASLATVLLWWSFAHRLSHTTQYSIAAVLALAITLIGIPAATLVARASGRKDPSIVVIDEVAGQLVAMIGAPAAWKPLVVAFVLFRIFDIVKPPPVRGLEKLPWGTGIMIDDIGAGLYALIFVQLLLRFGILG